MKDNVEKWRKVRGFDGYLVSTFGRVKALARAVKHISRNLHEETVTIRKEKILNRSRGCLWIHPLQTSAERKSKAD